MKTSGSGRANGSVLNASISYHFYQKWDQERQRMAEGRKETWEMEKVEREKAREFWEPAKVGKDDF